MLHRNSFYTIHGSSFSFVLYLQVLNSAMDPEADKRTKKALARVIVTQAESGIAEISEEFENLYEASLFDKIAEVTKGNYRELLLALLAKGSE